MVKQTAPTIVALPPVTVGGPQRYAVVCHNQVIPVQAVPKYVHVNQPQHNMGVSSARTQLVTVLGGSQPSVGAQVPYTMLQTNSGVVGEEGKVETKVLTTQQQMMSSRILTTTTTTPSLINTGISMQARAMVQTSSAGFQPKPQQQQMLGRQILTAPGNVALTMLPANLKSAAAAGGIRVISVTQVPTATSKGGPVYARVISQPRQPGVLSGQTVISQPRQAVLGGQRQAVLTTGQRQAVLVSGYTPPVTPKILSVTSGGQTTYTQELPRDNS